MARMTLIESLGQGMPLQGLLARFELMALVHMVVTSELPILELYEKQVELPGINGSGGMHCRVDRISTSQNSSS
jgi:hypothetical protein